MGTKLKGLIAVVLMLASVAVQALSLEEGRSRGLIGETLSGYVAVVKADPQADALAKRINDERAHYYQQIAKENQVSVRQVAELAGQKLVSRAPKGEFVRGLNGRWLQK